MCVCPTPPTLNAKPQLFFLSRDDKSKYTAIRILDPNVSPVTISLVDTERGGVRGWPSLLVMKGWKRPTQQEILAASKICEVRVDCERGSGRDARAGFVAKRSGPKGFCGLAQESFVTDV